MTIDEQFSKFGCACRCLIVLANAGGNQITKAEFIDAYSKKYPRCIQHDMCGVTSTGMILDIARNLKLAKSIQVFRNPDEVRKWIKRGDAAAVLFMTERVPNPPVINGITTYSDNLHCSIVSISSIAPDSFQILQVDGALRCQGDQILDSDIDQYAGYFLVLLPEET